MDNIFYERYVRKEMRALYGRKPYSKWTISSTAGSAYESASDCGSRKPYSKWTISSTSRQNQSTQRRDSRKPYSKWTISSTL